MKYKKFYREKLDPKLLERIDAKHKEKMQFFIRKIERGTWTRKQKNRQKSSILSNIALYKTFIDEGFSDKESYELVKEYSFYRAEKAHGILGALFRIPGFFKIFRFFMKKGRNIYVSN